MQEEQPYNEKETLRLIAQGNQEAFALVFNRYRQQVYGVAYKFLRSQPLAEEVTQEVFVKLWNKRSELRHILKFEAYLFTTARNLTLDSMEDLAEGVEAEKAFAYFQSNDEAEPDKQHVYQKVLDVVERLPSQQKQVFKLGKIEGLSQEVIAKRLNISSHTVKRHMNRALRTIRFTLQGHPGIFFICIQILSAERFFNCF